MPEDLRDTKSMFVRGVWQGYSRRINTGDNVTLFG